MIFDDEIEASFQSGLESHKAQIEGWIQGRDGAISALDWLGMTAARFESSWKNWIAVDGKRKALKSARKLKKQVAKTQAAVYDFMANAL